MDSVDMSSDILFSAKSSSTIRKRACIASFTTTLDGYANISVEGMASVAAHSHGRSGLWDGLRWLYQGFRACEGDGMASEVTWVPSPAAIKLSASF